MRNMHRILTLALALVLCAAPGAGRAARGAGEPNYRPGGGLIRFTLITLYRQNEYWQQVYSGIDLAKAELENVDVWVAHPGAPGNEAFLRCFDTAVAAQVDGVLSICCDDALQARISRQLRDAGIPLVLLGSDCFSPEMRDGYCGIDNIEAGRQAAGVLKTLVRDGVELGILASTVDTKAFLDRVQGLSESFEAGTCHVVDRVETSSDRFIAAQRTRDLLEAHPEINCLFCTDGLSGVGAASALENMGLSDSVVLITFDDDDPIPELLKRGAVDAYLRLPGSQIGREGVYMLYDLVNGGPTQQGNYLPCEVFLRPETEERS